METVLIIRATGNIGTAMAKGALRTGRHVLAVVRNSASAEKPFRSLGMKEGITTVEADILSDNVVQSVAARVKTGEFPKFQHVIASGRIKDQESTPTGYVSEMLSWWSVHRDSFERYHARRNAPNYVMAHHATIPYLLEQNNPNSSWTLCTGSQDETGLRAAPAITQGPLFSIAIAASRELHATNIRFNEVFVNLCVEVDGVAEKSSSMKASAFAKNYATILSKPSAKGCRTCVDEYDDLTELSYKPKLNL